MRGSRGAFQEDFFERGIIPAHAGLTSPRHIPAIAGGDHPRACGAHSVVSVLICVLLGSSPRMRGSPIQKAIDKKVAGIIPAHAGLTTMDTAFKLFSGDHPRACGAHSLAASFWLRFLGSSPRMRGSLAFTTAFLTIPGIIPAHAGLTLKNPNIDAILSGPHPVFYSVLRVIR